LGKRAKYDGFEIEGGLNKEKDSGENIEGEFTIQNWYIDFKVMIIGKKLKMIDEEEEEGDIDEAKNYVFDEKQMAELVMDGFANDKLFEADSIKKIVEFQFMQSQVFFKSLFWSYVILFIIPYAATLTVDDPDVNKKIILSCIIPQLFFLTVELIQLKQQGLGYFNAWNMIDFTQLCCFSVYAHSIININAENEEEYKKYVPFLCLKIALILFSFIKFISLLRVFEKMAIFIKLVGACLRDLVPFIQSYLAMNLFFTFCFAALDCTNDEDIDSAVGLSPVGRLSLQVWRQSVGKLSFALYPNVLNNESAGFMRTLNINMIWLFYYLSILWMFCIMLNFMIAVIEETYMDVENVS